jgi:hypothetical protein
METALQILGVPGAASDGAANWQWALWQWGWTKSGGAAVAGIPSRRRMEHRGVLLSHRATVFFRMYPVPTKARQTKELVWLCTCSFFIFDALALAVTYGVVV